MKLLLDQNLSHRLLQALRQEYPGSLHVRDVGLKDAADTEVWQYASEHDLTIVTKDADFHQRSFLFGHPPKVVWIRLGSCSTALIEDLLRRHRRELDAFWQDAEGAFLVIG
ncbi:MAG: DUF5615 family PIN-like protein [Nitrospiraceae bacterium]